jgi:hypothetical protein
LGEPVRLAISRGLPQSQVRTEDPQALERFVNAELRPALEQIRAANNVINAEKPVSVTSDGAGTLATLWTSDALPTDCQFSLTAEVHGVGTGLAADYKLAGSFQSAGGVVTQLGSTTVLHFYESAVAMTCDFNVDAANRTVFVEAQDAGTGAMAWTCEVQQREGLAA